MEAANTANRQVDKIHLLLGKAGEREARRTLLAVLVAATGERTDTAPPSNTR